jgi:tetratricopeptide (TPR) repeat protein
MTHKTHKNYLVKMLLYPASLGLVTGIFSIATVSVNANPESVNPPPPPKPLNSNSTRTSPPATPKDSMTEPFTNSNSASPVTPRATSTQATPAPATAATEASPQPEPEAVPTQTLSPETAAEETAPPPTTEQQQLESLIKTEVNQALDRRNSFFYTLFGAILIMIGGTWFFLWLLRQNLTKIVIGELQQKISGQLKAEIGEQIKAEISAEFVENLAQQRNSSALAIAQQPAKAIDNSTQINELISMAVATNNLLQETRSALEESRKLHDRINQPIKEIFEIYFKQATELLQQGEYEEAIDMYDKTLQTNPDSYEAWLGRGIAFTRLSQYETAIGCYNKALQLNSDHPEPWYEKARCYAIKKDIDLVIDNLQRAITINPNIRKLALQDPDFEIILDHEMFTQTS